MHRLTFVAGICVGYVFGARAGRTRYEQVARLAKRVAGNPRASGLAHGVTSSVGHGVAGAAARVPGMHFGRTHQPDEPAAHNGSGAYSK